MDEVSIWGNWLQCIWKLFVLSAQSFYKSKTVPKNKAHFKRVKYMLPISSVKNKYKFRDKNLEEFEFSGIAGWNVDTPLWKTVRQY